MDPRNLVGTTLDERYDVTRMIGGGGMGAVYEANHAGTGRRVAVKVISTGDLTKDAALVGRFQREARAAGSIDSQHICQVLDTGTDPVSGLPFMVMEYMVGEDLQQLLRRVGPLPPDLALKIAAQVCLALQQAHAAGIVHRDIKPANIFLAKRDGGAIVVKLLDFGIAKVKMEQASQTGDAGLTRTGTMLGSPLYMSPEQARGSKGIDHRADLWSLGVVLYECLCGRTPFHHIDALGELIIAICSEPPQPVQDHAAWLPADIAKVVHRALLADVNTRYASSTEMLDAFLALLPEQTVTLEEPMLVGLSEVQRHAVARRMTMPPPEEAPGVVHAASVPPGARTPAPGDEPQAATTDGVAAPTQRRPDTPSRSNAPLLIAGAAIGILVAGGVALKVTTDRNAAENLMAAQNAVVPPVQTVVVTASAAPAVSPVPDEKTVKLVVFPEDAEVTVDGKEAKVTKGYVEISGGLGSLHKIKLTLRGQSVEEEVVISESGPQPPKVELDVRKVGGRTVTPHPTPTATAVVPPKPPSGIETKFD